MILEITDGTAMVKINLLLKFRISLRCKYKMNIKITNLNTEN